jgi:hypothetical protein
MTNQLYIKLYGAELNIFLLPRSLKPKMETELRIYLVGGNLVVKDQRILSTQYSVTVSIIT